ncbi:hypothetical protein HXX76_013202 [Chlamydomonas incerta]|uniref:Uncharacterized protein n=1 Tax=Chlamydomonas incerta TaxID=51695 RepID=A0A835VR83_CHLIN|nr:hypothetical protein HXX76_013202 [Chlamydomonas incerta]|eukprot:KAG2426222.1 hypothetical protein HXX76_013202 [Chlamydomonas incerta]
MLARYIGDWLSSCPYADRPYSALLSDVEAWLRSGNNPGAQLWTNPAYRFPPLHELLTAPERGGCFRVVVREGHLGNDLVQLDLPALAARAAAGEPGGAAADRGNIPAPAPAAAAAPAPAAAHAAAASWVSSSARPSPARQLVESAFPGRAAEGDGCFDSLRRAIALGLADGPVPQLGPHHAPFSWLRDFIQQRELRAMWQAVSRRYVDECSFLVAPESHGVFRVQGMPLYAAGLVSLDMAALSRLAAAVPPPQPVPAAVQPPDWQQPQQPGALQQPAADAAAGSRETAGSRAAVAANAAPTSSAAAARTYTPGDIMLAVAAAWPGDAPQSVLRRQAGEELAAAGPCKELGGLEHSLNIADIAERLHNVQHAAAVQLRSAMGGRLEWHVLLTSDGGADLMPAHEAEEAITPLEAVAAAGDRYSRYLLRVVQGEGDIAVSLNLPELMWRYGSSGGSGAGAGGSGGLAEAVAGGWLARGAGEAAVGSCQQQPTTARTLMPAVAAGRAGQLPDGGMAAAAGGSGGTGSATAGGDGVNRSRRSAAVRGGSQSGPSSDASRWWHEPTSASGDGAGTVHRLLEEAEDEPDPRVEAALDSWFFGLGADATILRGAVRLLLQAPPPHVLSFSLLAEKVAQLLGGPYPGLWPLCLKWSHVLSLEGTDTAGWVRLVSDPLLRLAPSRRRQQAPPQHPAPQQSQTGAAANGEHTSRSAGAVPAVQPGAAGVARAAPDRDAWPAAPAAPPPAQRRTTAAADPRAQAGPAQRTASARSTDRVTTTALIRWAFPLRDNGADGRWTAPAPDQAALQLRRTVASWLAGSPEHRELGAGRATMSALAQYLEKRHAGVWLNPAHGFPSLGEFLRSPDSHEVFVVHAAPGSPDHMVELDAAALRRVALAPAERRQHQDDGAAAGGVGTAGARAEERGRQRGSTARAPAAGRGVTGAVHSSSDRGNGEGTVSSIRRSPGPGGAPSSSAAGASGGSAGAASGAAGAGATPSMLDDVTAALISAAFPLRLAADRPAPDQLARQLRHVVATWLASSPHASELGPRRAAMKALAAYLHEEHAGLWLNPAHGFLSVNRLLQSSGSRGVFVVHDSLPNVPRIVELDVHALVEAVSSAAADVGPVQDAAALRRAALAPAERRQHQDDGDAAGGVGTAGARAEERGRQRGSTARAPAAGRGVTGAVHSSSDRGNGEGTVSSIRRSPGPGGAPSSSAAGASGGSAGAASGTAGAGATPSMLDDVTAALISAAFPLRLAAGRPAPDQLARQLRHVVATWLASSPHASELGPRRAAMKALAAYLHEEHAGLWLNPAHGFLSVNRLLQSSGSRGVFVVHDSLPNVPRIVELDVRALIEAVSSAAADVGAVQEAGRQGGDDPTAAAEDTRQEPAAVAAANAHAAAPAVDGHDGPVAAPAAPVEPQHLPRRRVVPSATPEPEQLAPSAIQPALAGVAGPAASSGAAAGVSCWHQLLVPVPQRDPAHEAMASAAPTEVETGLPSLPAPALGALTSATWGLASAPLEAASASGAGTSDGLEVQAAPVAAGGLLQVAAPVEPQHLAGAEALAPAATSSYAQQPPASAAPLPATMAAALPAASSEPVVLPEADVCLVKDPYSDALAAMLQHCGCCTRLGVSVQAHGGSPALVSLYAPPGLMETEENLVQWPAAVYLIDPLAAAEAYGGGATGDAAAAELLCSLQPLLEAPSICKMIYGGGGAMWLRSVNMHVARLRHALADTGLWADRPQLLAALTSRHAAALRDDAQAEPDSTGMDDDAAARVLTRPLGPSQMEVAARCARHLPELWTALVHEAVPWVVGYASSADIASHRQQAA